MSMKADDLKQIVDVMEEVEQAVTGLARLVSASLQFEMDGVMVFAEHDGKDWSIEMNRRVRKP